MYTTQVVVWDFWTINRYHAIFQVEKTQPVPLEKSPKSFLISDTMGYMDFPQDGLIGPMDSPPKNDCAKKIPRKPYNYLELIQGFTVKVYIIGKSTM